ncbi:hypothetical protein CHARACLAT_016898 [Characodon lateralis]|uniref:Secreted protein n=1 Tax=Characodon lateralis TaxID=208331 RepID=A0ABU7CR66_9TELE|nr:hypothetical protein [Characodon lateralis]
MCVPVCVAALCVSKCLEGFLCTLSAEVHLPPQSLNMSSQHTHSNTQNPVTLLYFTSTFPHISLPLPFTATSFQLLLTPPQTEPAVLGQTARKIQRIRTTDWRNGKRKFLQ